MLVAPPYTVTEEELEVIVRTLAEAYDAVERDVDTIRAKI